MSLRRLHRWPTMPVTVWLALLLAASGGCKTRAKKRPAPPTAVAPAIDAAAGPPVFGAAQALGPATEESLGEAGPTRVIDAADDGAWVALCQGTIPELRVVVGRGVGVPVDRILASGPRDVIGSFGDDLRQIDVEARTVRTFPGVAPVAIEPGGRRIVVAHGASLIVLDPGAAPRAVATTDQVAAVRLVNARWAEVQYGAQVLPGSDCDPWTAFRSERELALVDLEPGLEAVERVGPELAITPAGAVTLDGEVVLGADSPCVATVVAALASPPRLMARCGSSKEQILGPGGFRKQVGIIAGTSQETQVMIAGDLALGHRMFCSSGGCADLITGAEFSTWQSPLVHVDDRYVLRKRGGGLLIDRLPADPTNAPVHVDLTLPRLVATVTVDTATGRRVNGAAPVPPEFIDITGDWLLYGRHVIDLASGTLTATLGADAMAIDDHGRVLMPARPGEGPLRWQLARP